ncbi:hypothetical protein NA56DRAFT_709393 [Hyaloscypha hepaticicola]|uniref:Uncharacterized protein n=1 Tax=Hyaloscypha hepaticicola TaxID=2082293 RepID=A0A2J6PPQ0_9HELO|nr:hypothetical protein NA56DRAFT_709393 [Hyaloscypha hepaticicola]
MLLALNAASLDHNCSCDGDAVSVKKNASASIQPILRIEIRYSCNTLLPSILHSPTGICPSAAVIPLRCAPRSADFSIISRLSATSRKAEQEGATIILQAHWHIPELPVVRRLSCICRSSREILLGRVLMKILPPRISLGPRNQDEYHMYCCKGQTHQETPSTSSTWGAARQKPGRVVVRHFCN